MTTTWREAPLRDVAEVRLGRQRSPKNHNGTNMRPYVRAANVGWSGLRLDDVKTMNFTDAEMRIYRLKPGDLLLGEASGSATEVGKSAIWNGEIEDCAFQNTLLRVRSHGPEPRYLLHYFRYQAETGQFAARSRGVGIFHLGRRALADLLVPLPPDDEQQRIAAALDTADQLRAKSREALSTLAAAAESIFLDMIGDPATNPKGWACPTLADSVELVQIGPFGSLLHQSDYVEGGVPLVNPMHIVDGAILPDSRHTVSAQKAESLKTYHLAASDVVIGRRGEMGRCAVVADDQEGMICGSGSLFVRPNASIVDPHYLQALLSSTAVRSTLERRAQGITMLNLNSSIIGAMTLPIPPLDQQYRYVAALAHVKMLRQHAIDQRNELDELFGSLQHRAFRGES